MEAVMHMMERVRKYVREITEDGFHWVAAFVIAWVAFGLAFYYNVDLTGIQDFNLVVIKYVTSLLPAVLSKRVEFGLRAWIEHGLFFSELMIFGAIVFRIIGLCLGLCWAIVCYFARWLHRCSRKRHTR